MKGRNALADFFIGSTTKQLIEKAPCPVLAVPHNSVLKNIKTIVYASDFEEEDISAISELADIAKVFNARIKIVHISSENEKDGQTEMEWFKEMVEQHLNYKALEFEIYNSDDIFNFLKNKQFIDDYDKYKRKTQHFPTLLAILIICLY